MGELISGKEALIALANGEVVQYNWENNPSREWMDVNEELREFSLHEILMMKSRHGNITLRLKPRTITLNGIEVPAPFEPKEDERYYFITDCSDGFSYRNNSHGQRVGIAAWRTKEEIKQVVDALRSIFNVERQ